MMFLNVTETVASVLMTVLPLRHQLLKKLRLKLGTFLFHFNKRLVAATFLDHADIIKACFWLTALLSEHMLVW